MSPSKRAQQARRAAPILALAALLAATGAHSQATDGDEQFQAYHQDIGRISGGAQHSQVAPNTIVRQLATTSAPLPPPAAPVLRHQQPPRQQVLPARRPQQASANRVTLTMRPHKQAAAAAPEPIVYSQQVPLAAAPPAPLPLAHTAQPALSSFRASAGHGLSVSARHSALMAQVAAERQAALTAAGGAYLEQPPPPPAAAAAAPVAPSLGQPLEALSSPPLAQVQAPFALHHQHQLQHQAAASAPSQLQASRPDLEPEVAPSFEHVLSSGCPRKGLFSYPNKDHCDRYYMCTNGTFTEEACPNGLLYGQQGAVYQHCAYQWNVECGAHQRRPEPIASPGCPWQFGIFPIEAAGRCSIDYYACEWGVPETKRCQPEGLFYDDRIKGCQWADQLGCKSEQLLNFKCPAEDEDNPYWPFPRYYHTKQDVVVCVNEQPRLVHCNEDQAVDPSSLACMDLDKKKKNRKPSF